LHAVTGCRSPERPSAAPSSGGSRAARAETRRSPQPGSAREVARASAPRVEAVDGTAAGDAFCAALLVHLLRGVDREQALRLACAAGAIAASRLGAQPSLPTAREVEELAAST
jgi:sugar/nucleoside kinase (ribokinase family)